MLSALAVLTLAGCSDYELEKNLDDQGWDTGDEPPNGGGGFDVEEDSDYSQPTGRVVTILLTVYDGDMPEQSSDLLTLNSVEFAYPWASTTDILIIRDDNHAGEDSSDPHRMAMTLANAGHSVTFRDEPEDGIAVQELEGFGVVIFSNPGHPIDDLRTVEALAAFSRQGLGLILQGDDMTREDDIGEALEELTRLRHVDNGTSFNGTMIDNNTGATYTVELEPDSTLALGMGATSFTYGNDIDSTTLLDDATEVVAWTHVTGEVAPTKPAITAWSP